MVLWRDGDQCKFGGIRGGSSKGLDNLRIAYERLESKRA
jgi:hypothetical protein